MILLIERGMNNMRIALTIALFTVIFMAKAQQNQQTVIQKIIKPVTSIGFAGSRNYGFELGLKRFKNLHGTPTANDRVEVKMFTSWATNITDSLTPHSSNNPNTYEYQEGMLYGAKGNMINADDAYKTLEDHWNYRFRSCSIEGMLYGCWRWGLASDIKSVNFKNLMYSYIHNTDSSWNLLALSLDVKIVITTYGNVTLDHIDRVKLPGVTVSHSEIVSTGNKSSFYNSSYWSAKDREIIYGEVRESGKPLDPTSYTGITLPSFPSVPIPHSVPDPNHNWNWRYYNFYLFEAKYSNGQPNVHIYVNSNSWPNSSNAENIAEKYAKALGRVPELLRDEQSDGKKFEVAIMNNFNNNWSVKPVAVPQTSGKVFQILVDDAWTTDARGAFGKLTEEVFMHELSHILHERYNISYDAGWTNAVSNDTYWLSDYGFNANGTPNPEDHSETFPVWLMYKYKRDRMFDPALIGEGLANRFQFYENQFLCSRIRPWSLIPRGNGPGCGELRIADESITGPSMNKEEDQLREFVVYPNPSQGGVKIDLTFEEASEGSYEVFDLSGKLLFGKVLTLPKGNSTIEINKDGRLGPGVYLIELVAPGMKETSRVIVE